MVSLLVLDLRDVADRGVEPGWYLSQCTRLDAVAFSTSARPRQERPVGFSCSMNSVLYSPIVDSTSALSRASPTVPIEPVIPASWSSSVNARDVY